MPAFKDLTGQHFTRLTAKKFVGRSESGHALWIFDCDCGAHDLVLSGVDVARGNTESCGCLGKERRAEANTKHGHAKRDAVPSRTYASYSAMMSRCYKEHVCQYPRYGGRGITVCERWRGECGFINFLADMGERPAGKTLDRYPNNDGNYELRNCRWATVKEQQNNRRNSNCQSMKRQR